MNIIRSKVVELENFPAVAYKVKLKQGGSGIKLHRTDKDETAFAQVDKRSGEAAIPKNISADIFPAEAFEEANELLLGLPYSSRGKVKILVMDTVEEDEIEVPEGEAPGCHKDPGANAVDSDEFIALSAMFSDENGKMNYKLMNKQFIQFAARNKKVSELVGQKASADEILLSIIKNRAAFFAGNRDNLEDSQALALIEAIEEIDPRSAFKELKLHIRKMLAR